MKQVLEYGRSDRRQHLRKLLKVKSFLYCLIVGVTALFFVANFRVLQAHHTLMAQIKAGQLNSNGSLNALGRLDYLTSIRPLLWKPWRSEFVLYYRNGWVQERVGRSYAKVW